MRALPIDQECKNLTPSRQVTGTLWCVILGFLIKLGGLCRTCLCCIPLPALMFTTLLKRSSIVNRGCMVRDCLVFWWHAFCIQSAGQMTLLL